MCVALSGGRDSVVLFDALRRLQASGSPFELTALHVHHGLSANADRWAEFCTQLCRQSDIRLRVVRVQVRCDGGEGREAAARRARHAAFADCAADWLALAHHGDDQAETVLFRLLRGAGVHGASGMPVERPLSSGVRLIRPLLGVSSAVLADYASACSLTWIDDESNADCRYRRNHLRREVMPRIRERFPGGVDSLLRAARHFAEAAAVVDEVAAADRAAVLNGSGRLATRCLLQLSEARARNLLRFEWALHGFRAPDARWLDEALRQLRAAGSDSGVHLSTRDGHLRQYRGELYLLPPSAPIDEDGLVWRGEAALPWGEGELRLSPSIGEGIGRRLLLAETVRVRRRQGGEQLQPDRRRPRRSLRKLLQEMAIPPWQRERLPLLWCGERLAWVAGIGVDAAFACSPGEEGMVAVWDTTVSSPPLSGSPANEP